MGEVERVRATYGASFGAYGSRVNGALDRQPKKHHHDQPEHHQPGDALELHEEGQEESTTQTFNLTPDQDEHLDLSA